MVGVLCTKRTVVLFVSQARKFLLLRRCICRIYVIETQTGTSLLETGSDEIFRTSTTTTTLKGNQKVSFCSAVPRGSVSIV
jgi:hypothetical protein